MRLDYVLKYLGIILGWIVDTIGRGYVILLRDIKSPP
jgi:hypothetical protein